MDEGRCGGGTCHRKTPPTESLAGLRPQLFDSPSRGELITSCTCCRLLYKLGANRANTSVPGQVATCPYTPRIETTRGGGTRTNPTAGAAFDRHSGVQRYMKGHHPHIWTGAGVTAVVNSERGGLFQQPPHGGRDGGGGFPTKKPLRRQNARETANFLFLISDNCRYQTIQHLSKPCQAQFRGPRRGFGRRFASFSAHLRPSCTPERVSRRRTGLPASPNDN